MTTPVIDQVDDDLRQLRDKASRKLDWQAGRAGRYQRYYDGEVFAPVIMDTDERETFRKFLQASGANWCELIVNAVADRLTVAGMRWGESSQLAWTLWEASHMVSDHKLVQKDALVAGSSFCLVQPWDDSPTGVRISAESPQQATVLYHPGDRHHRLAGYKRWRDHDDPDEQATTEVLITDDWLATWYGQDPAPDVQANPAGTVGLVEVTPQPRTKGAPRSELKPALAGQDRINTTIFSRLVATDFGAFRQVWATGVKLAREVMGTDEDTGEPITRPVAPYNVGANRLLVNENPDGRFGAFNGDPLAGFLAAVEQDVNQLAAITQTPPHYLLGSMVNLSADALTAAEAGLIAKVKNRALFIGEAWAEVTRLALGMVGDPEATNVAGQVIWADMETRSIAQLADALVKMQTIGVPQEALWERLGTSPEDIARWKAMAAEQQAQLAAAQAAALGAGDIAALLQAAGAGSGPR